MAMQPKYTQGYVWVDCQSTRDVLRFRNKEVYP